MRSQITARSFVLLHRAELSVLGGWEFYDETAKILADVILEVQTARVSELPIMVDGRDAYRANAGDKG